jgi:hypothetical protein
MRKRQLIEVRAEWAGTGPHGFPVCISHGKTGHLREVLVVRQGSRELDDGLFTFVEHHTTDTGMVSEELSPSHGGVLTPASDMARVAGLAQTVRQMHEALRTMLELDAEPGQLGVGSEYAVHYGLGISRFVERNHPDAVTGLDQSGRDHAEPEVLLAITSDQCNSHGSPVPPQ